MTNLKELMTNGVFGKTSDGDSFVIVDDLLVYQDGAFDEVRVMLQRIDDDYRVVKLVKGVKSFDQLANGHGTVIYDEKEAKNKDKNKDKNKSAEELMDEINELLEGIQKDAQSKGLSEKEAKHLTDGLFMAANFAALMEMLGEHS